MSQILASIASRILTNLFAPRPKVKREGVLLILESDWRTALFSLGARHRRVSVDPVNRIIRIRDRRFWAFIGRKVMTFDQIHEIVYSYTDFMGGDWLSHDSQDLFRVGLWLHDNQEVILFRFYGQGQFVNNSIYPDWMMWEDILPGKVVDHAMESESLAVAEVLSDMVGVPIGNGPP